MDKKLLLLAGAAITSAGVYSTSVMAVDGTGTSTARLVAAMTIAQTSPLAFGDIIRGVAGNVLITTAGGVTDTTVVSSNTQSAGAFDITGGANALYSISMPASTTITDGTDTMTVTGLNHNRAATGNVLSGTGTDALLVGGQLDVAGTEQAGSYNGTYLVTINYE